MVIIDTSVLYKWLVDEHDISTKRAIKLLRLYLSGDEQIIAPDILIYELSNILAYKTTLSINQIKEVWKLFCEYDINLYHPTLDFMQKNLDIALKYHITAYDASFVTLAMEKSGRFITADAKLIEAVPEKFIELL